MILFLDFDGVLHPAHVYYERGKIVLHAPEGITLFHWVPELEAALRGHPDVKIVLSTSWVPTLGFDEAKARLSAALQERVIGATWHSHFTREHGITREVWSVGMTRWQQIKMYVDRHCTDRWIAIDDNDEGWPFDKRHHLVKTHEDFGLGQADRVKELRAKLKAITARKGVRP